ncbi:hypothetical protein [Nocardioides sp. WS12]|uniref:hypothetical protein n=1 Tax=Nocardioides sp. WS12 TaxID=2486272 RepID=UPI0015FCA93D|nr:hypothetical protein [Nocardioides sp. WS12]
MTIVTYPTLRDGQVSVHGDVDLVKAASLYADEIELVSPVAGLLSAAGSIAAGGSEGMLELLLTMDDTTIARLGAGGKTQFPAGWRDMLRIALASPELATAAGIAPVMEEMRVKVASSSADFAYIAQGMIAAAGADQLSPFIEAGVLTISQLASVGVTDVVAAAAGSSQRQDADTTAAEWSNLIRKRIESARSSLLFDEPTEDFLRAMVAEGLVAEDGLGVRRAGEAAVGAGLVARLPAFPTARPDELLELRASLRSPMLRYRSGVAAFAREMPGVPKPSFDAHVQSLWSTQVEPALDEIHETIREQGLAREIGRSLSLDLAQTIASAGIFVGVHSHLGLQGLAAVVAGSAATATVPAATATVRGAQTHLAGQRATQRRELFYLYAVDKRLKGARG